MNRDKDTEKYGEQKPEKHTEQYGEQKSEKHTGQNAEGDTEKDTEKNTEKNTENRTVSCTKKRGGFRRRLSGFLIGLGSLLIAAALTLVIWNFYSDRQAGASSRAAVSSLREFIEASLAETADSTETWIPDYILNPDMDMPTAEVDGRSYVGTLAIPALGLELPVLDEWNYPNLRVAPCRYTGTAYKENLVIAAHNYASHFGNLKNLNQGDEVIFMDMDGNVFTYRVAEVEILQPTDIEEMISTDYPLTLFTCTIGGQTRVTVRCESVN